MYQENIALHQEIDGLRNQVRDLTGYMAGAHAQHVSDAQYREALEWQLAGLQRRVNRQARTITMLRHSSGIKRPPSRQQRGNDADHGQGAQKHVHCIHP